MEDSLSYITPCLKTKERKKTKKYHLKQALPVMVIWQMCPSSVNSLTNTHATKVHVSRALTVSQCVCGSSFKYQNNPIKEALFGG